MPSATEIQKIANRLGMQYDITYKWFWDNVQKTLELKKQNKVIEKDPFYNIEMWYDDFNELAEKEFGLDIEK